MSLSFNDELYLRSFDNDYGTCIGELGLQFQVDTFIGDGSTVTFTLSQTPSANYSPFITLAGVAQVSSQATISGPTLTFVTAPGNTIVVQVLYCH
jgi:hypothetical protein